MGEWGNFDDFGDRDDMNDLHGWGNGCVARTFSVQPPRAWPVRTPEED